MEEDSWQHRSKGMRCKTCMFYVGKKTMAPPYVELTPVEMETVLGGCPAGTAAGEIYPGKINEKPPDFIEPPMIGRCRRRAPTMNGYPVVWSNDWCGDHKIDENKITATFKIEERA